MNKTHIVHSSQGFKGWSERRLFDHMKFKRLIEAQGVKLPHDPRYYKDINYVFAKAIKSGLNEHYVAELLDSCAKPMFQTNSLWRLINKIFNKDVAIPFVTGYWTLKPLTHNLVTTRGKRIVMDQVGGTTTVPVTAIALGSNSTAAAAGDTALNTEITTNGGQRGAATVTNTTTTTTGDTEQWQKTFTFSGSLTIREEGLFDNNTSGGNMLARQTFSDQVVGNGDTLQVTHKVQATT